MELTPALVAARAEAYDDVQPLAAVEAEHADMLPEMLATGEFGWRDAEWVVQWYYRRFLGAYPDAERRAAEDAFGENDYDAVRDALAAAAAAGDAAAKLDHLTRLTGVDVSVGSAFLQFLDPEAYLVCSAREWGVLRAAGELDGDYPDPLSVPAYERCLATCRGVAGRCDCSLPTLYRALWTLGGE